MTTPDKADDPYRGALEPAVAELSRLVAITRALTASAGERQAAADIGGLLQGLGSGELAGLLTAALIQLAGRGPASPAQTRWTA